MKRRERYAILGDILDAVARVADQAGNGGGITAVATRANLPHDRLTPYIAELRAAGLVEGETFALTPDGRAFLAKYRAWRRVIDRFGLES